MRILSNDYISNLPKSKHIAHGGPANFARPFSSYVANAGHKWIGVIFQTKELKTPTIKKKSSDQDKTHYIFSTQKSNLDSFMQLKRRCEPSDYFKLEITALRSFIRRTKPDILFLNGYSVFAWLLLEAAKQEQLPIVIQHAGISQIEFKLYAHLYSTAARAMVLDMERDIVNTASKQIFLNDYSLKYFCKNVANVPKKQSIVIPLPYNQAFAETAAIASNANNQDTKRNITIGCIARWDRIKNHLAILKLAKEAKIQKLPWAFKSVTKIPDTKIQIRFKQAYRKAIEIVPPMKFTELIPFYQSLDLVILPSIFDVSPTVIMEAALLDKTTLISPTVGWTSEYKSNGMNDWIVDFSNPKIVIKRIQKILKQKNLTRFSKYIKAKHAPKTVFNEYLRVFKSVL